jgi:hypothetical protein
MSSTYANILKYHIQGMPTNILQCVYIKIDDNYMRAYTWGFWTSFQNGQ